MGCISVITQEDFDQIINTYESAEPTVTVDMSSLILAETFYGEDIAELLYIYGDAPDYVNAILECLNEVAEARIVGMEEVIYDLCKGGRTATGAEFQLKYILDHKNEIAEVEVPSVRFRDDGSVYALKGADILNKDGSNTELKCFDFSKDYYRSNAESVAAKVVAQAKDRIEKGATKVIISFSKWGGEMSKEFQLALEKSIGTNNKIKWNVE